MDLTVLSWNMAGGNWRFKDNFLNNMARFFDHINSKRISIDVICSQEVMSDAQFWDIENKRWTQPWGEYAGYQPGGLIEGIEQRFKKEGYDFNTVSHQVKPLEHNLNEFEAKVIWSRKEITHSGDQTIVKSKRDALTERSTWSRTVVHAEIKLNGKKVYIFNYHGPNLGTKGVKVKFARYVEQYVRDVTNGFSEAFILTGDFNLTEYVYVPFTLYNHLSLRTIETSWLDWQLSNLPSSREEITITPPVTDHNKLYVCTYTL